MCMIKRVPFHSLLECLQFRVNELHNLVEGVGLEESEAGLATAFSFRLGCGCGLPVPELIHAEGESVQVAHRGCALRFVR